ncbi:MAG: hypothetical protein AB1650_04085 [Candidatus Omnitrophota bacterium]
MIRFLRKHSIERLRLLVNQEQKRQALLSSTKGQVGLVLILLAALGLIFYAMSLNLSKISNAKIQTMVAAQKAAMFMASFMASYAQRLSEEQLEGGLRKCSSTSLFKRIVLAVVLVIIVIIATITEQPWMWAAVVAAVASTAAAIIDAVYIQPSLTDMWNEMMVRTLTPQGQLIEYGMQTALRTVIDDNVEFPDVGDFDADGVFGWDFQTVGGVDQLTTVNDYTNRFAYYYTLRLGQVTPPDTAAVAELGKQLNDFIYFFDSQVEPVDASDDVWGLTDITADNAAHVCNTANRPAECDPCCVPARAACCDINVCPSGTVCPGPDCCNSCLLTDPSCVYEGISASCASGTNANCGNTSYVGDTATGNIFPLVYDPFYEDTTNTIFSLREQIGRDDESPVYAVNSANPNWHIEAGIPATTSHQILRAGVLDPAAPVPDTWFYDATAAAVENPRDWYKIQDVGGFYTMDPQQGVFPFLYAIQDIESNLSLARSASYARLRCYWIDDNVCSMESYSDPLKKGAQLFPLALGALNPFSGGNEVIDLGTGGMPDIVDRPNLFLRNDLCLIEGEYGWKRGTDLYCSAKDLSSPDENYPYYTECGKHGNCVVDGMDTDCLCGEGNSWDPKYFNEDSMDDLYYGLPEFISWSNDLVSRIASSEMISFMSVSSNEWYREGELWVEALDEWRSQMSYFYNEIDGWIYPGAAASYAGSPVCVGDMEGVGEIKTWCMPSPVGVANEFGLNECMGISPEEQLTFNVNQADADNPGSGYRGDLEDVVACLNWNVNDVNTFYDELGVFQTATGNQQKFQQCANHCGPWACRNLPRSPVPFTGGYAWLENAILTGIDVYWSDKEMYINCLNSHSYSQCNSACDPLSVLPLVNPVTGVPYTINPATYNIADVANIILIEQAKIRWEDDCASVGTFNETLDCNGSTIDILTCNPAEAANFDFCISQWDGGSCEAIVTQGLSPVDPDPDRVFYNSLVALTDGAAANDEADDTTGFCNEPAFLQWVQESANASENIILKLNQRLVYLNYVLQEGLRARLVFGEAVDRFSEFLDNNTPYVTGPAANEDTLGAGYLFPDLERDVEWIREGEVMDDGTNVYVHYDVDSPAELMRALAEETATLDVTGTNSNSLPSVAIYVWRGPDLPPGKTRMIGGFPSNIGYVHAVKVEVRAPGRCNGACITDVWPWIETETSKWGTKRCYYLRDYEGRAKARAIRYDEPVDTSNSAFSFANGVSIWGMSTAHPDVGPGNTATIFADATPAPGDESVCFQQIDPLIRLIGTRVAGVPGQTDTLHHAFMLNRIPDIMSGDDYSRCWTDVHQDLLSHGVHTDSCAMYVWEGLDMGVKFVPCDQDFLTGIN